MKSYLLTLYMYTIKLLTYSCARTFTLKANRKSACCNLTFGLDMWPRYLHNIQYMQQFWPWPSVSDILCDNPSLQNKLKLLFLCLALFHTWICLIFSKKSASTSLSLSAIRSENMSCDGKVFTSTDKTAINSCRTFYEERECHSN